MQETPTIRPAPRFKKIPDPRDSLAGFKRLPAFEQAYLDGYVEAAGRSIPRARTRLAPADHLGGWGARWNFGRMRYSVPPGLYAVGQPEPGSEVFVTANYKLSFDRLREALAGLSGWVLVLDTRGINVWCAAGKGSFGTEELLAKLRALRLEELVSHRRLILPELGAPGVSAPEVARRSGFVIHWGPVQAKDIRAYLNAGKRKTEAMRRVPFGLGERLAVAPVEFVQAWPLAPAAFAVAALFALPGGSGYGERFLRAFPPLLGLWPLATFGFAALLPLLPSRRFAVKGALLGAAWGLGAALAAGQAPLAAAAFGLVGAGVASFLGMNYTGASAITSPSGAEREVRGSLLPQALALAAGLALGAAARLVG